MDNYLKLMNSYTILPASSEAAPSEVKKEKWWYIKNFKRMVMFTGLFVGYFAVVVGVLILCVALSPIYKGSVRENIAIAGGITLVVGLVFSIVSHLYIKKKYESKKRVKE